MPSSARLYLDLAKRIAAESKATRLKVGCVLVRGDSIIGMGYNGTAPGADNTCERDGATLPEVIHAEENAVCKAAREGVRTLGAVAFLTHSPCIHCAKILYRAGISRVIFETLYRDPRPLAWLTDRGVIVETLRQARQE